MDFLPFTRPSIDEETVQDVAAVLRSGWLTGGPKVKEFESALSEYFSGRIVRTLNSGTAALEVALQLCNIGPGDEVITTPLSWVATANVILHVGAIPIFVDVDPATRNIDLDQVESAITPRTRAIIPVDLAGLPVDRDKLYQIARKNNLRVIEDAAQSMGSTWGGQKIGSFGDLISISFHANKNMTSAEGGCLVLNNESEIPLFEKLRLQGVVRFPDGNMDVDVAGGKSNLTDVAAQIGLGQLKRLDEFNNKRRELAEHYFACFDTELGCGMPVRDFTDSNWHMFQVLLPLNNLTLSRGDFIARMREKNIGTGVHYPAIHLFTLYRKLGFKEGMFPHAEKIGSETITLPLFPAMVKSDVERVCEATAEIIKDARK